MILLGSEMFLLPGEFVLKSFVWSVVLFMSYNAIVRIYALLVPYKKAEMWDRLKEKNG